MVDPSHINSATGATSLRAGVFEGSFVLSSTDPCPSGITIDPNNINHIWTVDASTVASRQKLRSDRWSQACQA